MFIFNLIAGALALNALTAQATQAAPTSATSGATKAKPATHADWVGEYASTNETDDAQFSVSAHLQVSECTPKQCHYTFSAGSTQSECSSQGTFTFKTEKLGEDPVTVEPITEDGARGQCVISLDRAKNGKITVDAKDVFKSKKDEEFGHPCNNLCGAQGAAFFGVEIPKISDVIFYPTSFSCIGPKLSAVEKQICTSRELAQKDNELSKDVAKLKRDQPKVVAKLTIDQRAWLKARDSKCTDPQNLEACLIDVYEARLKGLSAYK